jgi:UDP-N-acetylmuramoyl-tripeptide--D-alanyl-D-alanine ligase
MATEDIYRVAIDSRLVEPGDLFVALAGDPGERFNPSVRSTADGHDYVADAASKGAAAALVSRTQSVDIPQYRVEDTYSGLWALGAAARNRLTGPVIAVTGSSGKTTAKTFLSKALDAYAPPGSLNNHIGVPLSLANALLGGCSRLEPVIPAKSHRLLRWFGRIWQCCSMCTTPTSRIFPPAQL